MIVMISSFISPLSLIRLPTEAYPVCHKRPTDASLYIPSGIVLPVVYKKTNRFGKTVAAGAFISLCIEILQLPFASSVSDMDDLILNTPGTAGR